MEKCKSIVYSQTLVPALVFIKSSDESLKIKTKQVNICRDNNHLNIKYNTEAKLINNMKEFDYICLVPTTEVGGEGYRECIAYGVNEGDTEATPLGFHDSGWFGSKHYQFDFECPVSNINAPCIRIWKKEQKISEEVFSTYNIYFR